MNAQKILPLLPKATAIWLIENTSLTFKQIADFCGIHEFEIKGMADGEVAQSIKGLDPVANGQLTVEEIERCSKDPQSSLQIVISSAYELMNNKKKQRAKYTPIARRQDKPDAIYWLLRNYPTIQDNQILKLMGTTKSTIAAIRDRSHWNMKNIHARDPVLLGICSQVELNKIIEQLELPSAKNHGNENTDTK
ncbi:cell cycle transcriptional regulator TrcR [Rickettsia endosymbiont of Polydrusus tereticollis]|uniref:cell cycle transcriptional regulator TrcR n=1 Tax=Rickettsia endosymbiont of Polydrusus tereticollis TaxID=3066251 RepID=UPI0031331378